MSAILLAVFDLHGDAVDLRTRFVQEGFPTDRVTLTSTEELGPVDLIPRPTLKEKLSEYFSNALPSDEASRNEAAVQRFTTAVMSGKAALMVQPRGEVETERALQLLETSGVTELRATDLDKQSLEGAAAKTETPVLTWFGKALAAPGAPDTTGTAKLP